MASSIIAQSKFYASTNAKEVLAGSYFQIGFVLENANGSQFQAPDFDGLEVVSGPNLSSNISISNGMRSQKKSFNYTVLANNPGTITIRQASIKVEGRILKSDPISIKVVRAGTRKNPVKNDLSKKVFVQAEISDTVAYPGQQLLLRYVLYTTVRVKSYNILSDPIYEGFYTQAISTNDAGERRVIDGVEYQSQVIKTVALFPQKLGDLNAEAVQFSLGLSNRNDPFTFFGNTKQHNVVTNEVWVRVIPLPEDAPESFNGALGRFNMESGINKKQLSTDDALSLKVRITGNGLSKFIEAPKIDLGQDFDVYDPKVINENVYAAKEDIISEKTFEYLLVPLKEGRKKVQVKFSYFDTDSSKYLTLLSPPYSVNILAGQNSLLGLSAEELLEKYQLKPLMLNTSLKKGNKYFYGSTGFWILVSLLFLLMPLMLLLRWYKIKQGKIDPKLLRRKKASKEALKRLAHARDFLDNENHSSFYKAVSDSLIKYISDKFSIETLNFTKENIQKELDSKGVPEELSTEYLDILKKCELALFAGSDLKGSLKMYERSYALLEELEILISKA